MNRRALLGFILLNVVVTFVTVFAIISIWQRLSPPPTRQPLSPPIIVVYTTTPNPLVTQVYVTVVTATPQPNASAPQAVAFNKDRVGDTGRCTKRLAHAGIRWQAEVVRRAFLFWPPQ